MKKNNLKKKAKKKSRKPKIHTGPDGRKFIQIGKKKFYIQLNEGISNKQLMKLLQKFVKSKKKTKQRVKRQKKVQPKDLPKTLDVTGSGVVSDLARIKAYLDAEKKPKAKDENRDDTLRIRGPDASEGAITVYDERGEPVNFNAKQYRLVSGAAENVFQILGAQDDQIQKMEKHAEAMQKREDAHKRQIAERKPYAKLKKWKKLVKLANILEPDEGITKKEQAFKVILKEYLVI